MTFPGSLKLITLTGEFLHGDNADPREGTILITLPTPIRSEGDDIIIPPFDLTVELVAGSFSVDLPATTDPEWLPNTAQYVIQASFSEDFRKLWWQIALPWDTAGDTLDLADVGAPNVGTPSLTIRQGTSQPLADGGYRATWGAGTLYRTGDTVQHGSVVYGALKPSTGVTPGTNAAIWKAYPSSGGGGGAVDSVFGRSGDVVAQAGDYGIAQITGLQASLDGKQPLDADLTAIAALAAANGDLVQRVAGVWSNQTPAQVKISLALIKGDVGLGNVDNTSDAAKPVSSATQTALNAKADLAGPALTGTTTVVNTTQSGRALIGVDALVDAATITVDASLGNQFSVTLGGNRTLGNPTNPPGAGFTQMIIILLKQDSTGSRTITLDTKYRLGTDISAVTLSTGANKTDLLGIRYNQPDDKWDVIAFVKGY